MVSPLRAARLTRATAASMPPREEPSGARSRLGYGVFGMEERAGGGNVREAAPDEGPREKRGQVRERGGDVEDGRIEPAGHASTVP